MPDTLQDSIELKGSCLCGDKTYRAQGQLLGFYHCHCRRCQKASGTGHASLIILMPGQLEIFGDLDDIGWYKIPEAIRFGNRFCKGCGGPLPREAKGSQRVVIQAGTLDESIDIEPQARIFWESRSSWSCTDALPKFDEYPT